ncbi:MAG: hypothetical protein N2171_08610 [Clostridia bacterium]|nr:hypothetical protein [Clostridia bacterium]
MSKISRDNKKKLQKYACVNQEKVNSMTSFAAQQNQNHNAKKEGMGQNTMQ